MSSAAILAAGLAVVCGLGVRLILPRLAEPAVTGPDAPAKAPYAQLADPPMVIVCTVLGALGGYALGHFLPPALWPAWMAWLSLGLLLVAIDARTTWLPLSLTRVLWALTAASVPLVGVLDGWQTAVRMLLAALAVGAFFGLFWWLRPAALGFGDVRLAPVLGAVCGTISVTAVFTGLLIGTGLGAVFGLGRHLLHRRGEFAYGPVLWAGSVALIPLFPLFG
ncbi:prepilin peptidase [Naumannella halotolerans]|uniref:Leader peptidase (Prepilin peptidase)/N-methyltransferase n=1 Tax=Naumannella halotolerans TaxID=993414 RepID=A0A4R7J8B0_9ACTN|nr:prepilin peptidase [Naumannella halotolerans]TDT32757.1 leader peptidase (prepilin peptidase)/N-methyltransferase [Naumannella halotolerans]